MQDSSRDGPRFSRGASNIIANGAIFNQVGRDQYNNHQHYNNPMNDEMVADAYFSKLPCAARAGYSSGNHKSCLKGTREEVLWDIEAWEADEMNESVYWLKGVAGCGKSTIAQTFAERSAVKGKLGASFFCSRDYPDRRDLHLIFLTLACDLAYRSADFKTALVPIIRANPNVQDDSLPVQLEKLLVRPFKQTGLSATIVVDALDECEDKEPVSEFLSALAVHVNNMPTVRFFITGRPEDHIRSGFKLSSLRTKVLPLHDVNSATVDSDIKSFVAFRLDEIATRRRQSISGQWPSDRDIAVILKKTSGLFIIASVILRFIDSSVASPQKLLKLIVDPPESTIYEGRSGIDVVYHQILSAIFEHANDDDAVFFDQLHLVVGSIVLALKPLPRASLAEILEMTPQDIWTILTHLHSILIVPESESEPIRILHKSFADFITDKERCPDARHFIDAPHHHSALGIYCLKLMNTRLVENICGVPQYAMNNDVEDLPARQVLCIAAPLSYACSSWAKHLQLSSQAGGNTSSVLTLVNNFFTHHLLSWLEVLSIEEHLHTAIYSLHNVKYWLSKNPDQDLSDLIDDCERFVLRSFDGVKQSAMHTYHSALSWTPTSSTTRLLYECKLMTETKLVNAVGPTWDACIRIIPVAVGMSLEAVVFSPSGALIAAHGEYCMKVFDAMTGVNRATFIMQAPICSVTFSLDDGFLVSGLFGGTINVWDVQTGIIFRTFKWNSSAYSVAFSYCGTMLASGGSDKTVQIWNILSGGCDCVFHGHLGVVTDVCWLAPWNQVISTSNDLTPTPPCCLTPRQTEVYQVRIWDVQKQTCLKIFAQYSEPVVALASSQHLLLVASKNGTVNIYDSQSGDIIHVIKSNDMTHSRFSVDGGKVLVAKRNLGDIWDITTNTLTHVGSIEYNGEQAIFSPDGTCAASIYGQSVKIWKTNAGYNHHEASTHVYDTINVFISPDEWLVTLKSEKGANILDATTGQSLFTYPVTDFLAIGFSLDLTFTAFLLSDSTVQTWNAHTRRHKSIVVDDSVFHIALSPNGSQLASLSPYHMKLWDLKSGGCLAFQNFLQFDNLLQLEAQISFSTDATSVSVLVNSGPTQSWCISPNHNNTLTRHHVNNHGPMKLPMIFVGITEGQPNQDASVPSYYCNTDDEWILDQDGRCVLWIPPDERPQRIWNSIKHEKVMVIQTESGKVYIVNFLQS